MGKLVKETESAVPAMATSGGGIDGIGAPSSASPEPGVHKKKKQRVIPFKMFLRDTKE